MNSCGRCGCLLTSKEALGQVQHKCKIRDGTVKSLRTSYAFKGNSSTESDYGARLDYAEAMNRDD